MLSNKGSAAVSLLVYKITYNNGFNHVSITKCSSHYSSVSLLFWLIPFFFQTSAFYPSPPGVCVWGWGSLTRLSYRNLTGKVSVYRSMNIWLVATPMKKTILSPSNHQLPLSLQRGTGFCEPSPSTTESWKAPSCEVFTDNNYRELISWVQWACHVWKTAVPPCFIPSCDS